MKARKAVLIAYFALCFLAGPVARTGMLDTLPAFAPVTGTTNDPPGPWCMWTEMAQCTIDI